MSVLRFHSPFRSPLFWRLLLWFCAANLLALALGGFLTRRFIDYTTQVEIDWQALAQEAEQAYEDGGPPALARWSMAQRRDGIEATLFEDGRPLTPLRLPPPIRQALPAWLGMQRDAVLRPWPGSYFAVQQVAGRDGRARQLVALSRVHARYPRTTRNRIYLLIQLGSSLLLIGVAGWWIARSMARPVEALRDATRRMAAGEFSTRVGTRWSAPQDELGQLSRDFNAMAERIETLVAHERGVLQDISHELRSPLARLHLILALAQRSEGEEAARHFARAEQEIERLDRMTGQVLALSRLEAGLPGMQREPVDLAALAVGRLQAARIEAEARGIRLRADAPAPALVSGSAVLLERALDNLIANAIKFSPAGGEVELRVRSGQGTAELCLRDHGPGVPGDELALLFRPFYRGSNAARAEGHGLGLSIVRRVAQAHGGEVAAANAEGGGLQVTLRLPLA